MKFKHKLLVSMILGVLFTLGLVHPVEASEADYGVKPIMTDTQSLDISSYFDVTVKPGSVQPFTLEIANDSTEEKEFSVQPNTAITNSNGLIDYSVHGAPNNNGAEFQFEELLSEAQTVKIQAGQKAQVTFEMKVPKEEFKGILLGGFVVTPIAKEKSKETIVNLYTHTIAAVIREAKAVVAPGLNVPVVTIGQVNHRNVIKTTIQNTEPTMINKLKMTLKITKKNSTNLLYEEVTDKLKMAPNSEFSYPLYIKENFSKGDYTANIVLATEEKEWTFTKDFTIKEDEQKKFNKESIDTDSPNKEQNAINIWLFVITILLAGVVIYQRKRVK